MKMTAILFMTVCVFAGCTRVIPEDVLKSVNKTISSVRREPPLVAG
ncbi:MAG: hypothetical protein JRJ09_00045 [Deltaproteobacteria bacterium]|nr:hypothetical protein [Deltaproteobacteria bacterium]MBW2110952.1 hypothetical protein [Deltaproteobacteria bacterium]MBW2351738.1 hypothetical protein [Deltaproteobacteria bacterium]